MEQTILSLEKAAMERWRNGDPMGFVEISAEDISYVDPGLTKPILGLVEFKAYMQQLEGQDPLSKIRIYRPQGGNSRRCGIAILQLSFIPAHS